MKKFLQKMTAVLLSLLIVSLFVGMLWPTPPKGETVFGGVTTPQLLEAGEDSSQKQQEPSPQEESMPEEETASEEEPASSQESSDPSSQDVKEEDFSNQQSASSGTASSSQQAGNTASSRPGGSSQGNVSQGNTSQGDSAGNASGSAENGSSSSKPSGMSPGEGNASEGPVSSKPADQGGGIPSNPGDDSVSSKPAGDGEENTSSEPSDTPGGSTPSPGPEETPSGQIVAGYYTGWSAYKGFTPDKVAANLLTHLNYAFAKIDPDTHRIALADPENDKRNFAAIRKLKEKNPQLKALISVGGWDYSTYFSDAAASAASRETFAQSCVDFILEHGLDGVDLDWEYPVSGGMGNNTNRPEDKQNFTKLLRAIRQKLDAQGKKDGRRYYLTVAGAANTSYLSKIEPQSVASLVDYIFVMAYDIHGPWDSYADLNAPLYQPGENSPQYKNSVYDGVKAYLDKGVSAQKLVLGMPFYGYIYQGVDSWNNGLYSAYSSAKSISYDTVMASYLNQAGYQAFWHDTAQVPYLYGKNTFITYEDKTSISAKASLARRLGLAGVGAWELSFDSTGTLLKSACAEFARTGSDSAGALPVSKALPRNIESLSCLPQRRVYWTAA